MGRAVISSGGSGSSSGSTTPSCVALPLLLQGQEGRDLCDLP